MNKTKISSRWANFKIEDDWKKNSLFNLHANGISIKYYEDEFKISLGEISMNAKSNLLNLKTNDLSRISISIAGTIQAHSTFKAQSDVYLNSLNAFTGSEMLGPVVFKDITNENLLGTCTEASFKNWLKTSIFDLTDVTANCYTGALFRDNVENPAEFRAITGEDINGGALSVNSVNIGTNPLSTSILNITGSEDGGNVRAIKMYNSNTSDNTSVSIDAGISSLADRWHGRILFERTNLGGSLASSIKIFARPADGGAGPELMQQLIETGFNNQNPFTKIDSAVHLKETNVYAGTEGSPQQVDVRGVSTLNVITEYWGTAITLTNGQPGQLLIINTQHDSIPPIAEGLIVYTDKGDTFLLENRMCHILTFSEAFDHWFVQGETERS